MLNKQQVSHYISFSAIPLSLVWFILEPGIEPLIVGLYGVNSIIGQGLPWNYRKYASKRNIGTVSFNFNKNGKKYEFGKDATYFETQWSSRLYLLSQEGPEFVLPGFGVGQTLDSGTAACRLTAVTVDSR